MNREYIAIDAGSDDYAVPLIYFMVRNKLYFQPLENKGTNERMHESSYSLKTFPDRAGVRGWVVGAIEVNKYLMTRELLR